MKKVLFLSLFLLSYFALQAEVTKTIDEEIRQNLSVGASSQGYEFMIAIPPNETSTWATGDLVIYVSSTQPTEVTLSLGATGTLIAKKNIISPLGVVTFSNATGEINHKGNEVRIPETVLNMGLRITSSTNPVSVFVLNSKTTTSDGFMAIPTSSWGMDYIHVAYYDKHEGTDNAMGLQYFGAGFIIVAAEDSTKVEIELRGVGGEFASTTMGKKPGDPAYQIILNKGQVYMVQGDGTSLGSFDLTGSRISSDKPIGLLSYHQRTDLPGLIGSSRDHLVEMMPPVSAWGKEYNSIEFDRSDRGDLFRIVASEPMTKYNVIWYDMKSDEILGTRTGTLKRSGDFVDISEEMQAPGVGYNSIRGVSHFEADKPILVMQYAYSAGWDGFSRYDPFMLCVTSADQFSKTTVFQTPGSEFTNNHFNIIAVGDTLDTLNNAMLLESIKIDGKPILTLAPNFKQAQIPNTNLFWARIKVNPGAHYIVGDTPFGGYIYGFTNVDSYGWPASMAINDVQSNDKVPPVVETIQNNNSSYTINFTDNSSEASGVSLRPTLLAGSYNFTQPIFASEFKTYPPTFDGSFVLNVIEETSDAKAYFSVKDKGGNETIDSILYEGKQISKVNLISPNNNAVDVSRSPEFTWENTNTDCSLFLTDNIADISTVEYFTTSTNTYNINQLLKRGQTYYWMVKPETSNLSISDIWSFKVSTYIDSVNLTQPANNSINQELKPVFQWNDVQVEEYEFELSPTSDFQQSMILTTATNSSNIVFNLDENTEYFWRVTAKDNGYHTSSEIFKFKTKIISSIGNTNESDKIELSPNPVKDNFTLNFDGNIITGKIENMFGELMDNLKNYFPSNGVVQIDIKSLPQGTYFLTLETDKGIFTKKFTIVK